GWRAMATFEGKAALALILVTAVLLVLPWRYPLPFWLVLWVLGVVAVSTVAQCWNLSPYGWPGWSSWNFGAATFLLFMVALRGRVWWGLVGMILMSILTIHWTYTTTGDWFHGFDLTYRQVASYFAGAFFAFWLERTARRIVAYQEAERRRVAVEQGVAAATEERQQQLKRIRQLAGPALRNIAAGAVTADQRREHALLEADLRDQIRGRNLAAGDLPGALRAARLRGVEVDLLDDLREDAPDEHVLGPAIAWAAERVDRVASGSATVRLTRVGGEPVVTFATGDGGAETFTLRVG
ncbi:MAG TPA: hypothetical protein VNS80_00325, partial [Pseudolysinimonas sp.]|nr:hypothetical protein [Pseudolysinimonas sp.]